MLKKICYIILISNISGCGFHLRSIKAAPQWLRNVSIIAQPGQRELHNLLSNQLQADNIVINPDPALATYWLVIESEHIDRHIISVSSSTTPRQYQLAYSINFKLQLSLIHI